MRYHKGPGRSGRAHPQGPRQARQRGVAVNGLTVSGLTVALLLLVAVSSLAASADAGQPTPAEVGKALSDLAGGDWILQVAAMRQLVDWKRPESGRALRGLLAGKGDAWVRGQALVALAELDGAGVRAEALAAAGDASPPLRAAAADAMGLIGAGFDAAIEKLLADPDGQVRRRATVAWARVKGPAAAPAVKALLASKDPVDLQAAAEALTHVRDEWSGRELVALLGAEATSVRIAAARSAGAAGVAAAIGPLLEHTARDADAEVRAACRGVLAAMPVGTVTGPMLAALAGEDKALHASAMDVLLARPSPAAAEAVAKLIQADRARLAAVLPGALTLLAQVDGNRHRAVIADHLAAGDQPTRLAAIRGLARCSECDLFAAMKPLLIDRDAAVRTEAYRVLQQNAAGAPKGGIAEYLREALAAPGETAAAPAVDLLIDRLTAPEAPRAAAILDPILGSKNDPLRRKAAGALGRVADEALARRIAVAQGFLTQWQVVGPYAGGLPRIYPPEWQAGPDAACPRGIWPAGGSFAVAAAVSGGVEKADSLQLCPPAGRGGGRTVALYAIPLPKAKQVTLNLLAGLADVPAEGRTNGAALTVGPYAADRPLAEIKLPAPDGWAGRQVDLSAFAGTTLRLQLAADALGDSANDTIALAQAEVQADGKAVADLIKLADQAGVWAEPAGEEPAGRWQPAETVGPFGEILFSDLMRSSLPSRIGYATAEVAAPAARDVAVHVEAWDGFRLWLNGELVLEKTTYGYATGKAKLRAGRNALLLKVAGGDAWKASVRLTDPDGARVDALTR